MTGMTNRCTCPGQRCGHCHGREDARWAVPALGVILAVAAIGLIREHGRGALEAAQVAGYALFGLAVLAAAVLIAWRIRKQRTRARGPRVRAVITSARPARLGSTGRRTIRQGRPAHRALPRRHDREGS